MTAAFALLLRDLRLGLRQSIDVAIVVLFFLAAGILFPFAVGPAPGTLSQIAGGVVLVMAALAALLSLDRLYQPDYEDGSLDGLILSPLSLEVVALMKALSHWLSTGLPLMVAAPLLALMLNLPAEAYLPMLAALGLATPILSLLGGLGAALTLGSRRGGVLLTFIILPLYVPVLIFAVAAIDAARLGFAGQQNFLFILAGLALATLALTPWATASALRQAVG
ncbi:heme exporter protein CcmB [Dongia soli]|uniref:Heme exporter protein B n=1 Tax=Dongia soli TaxID=600628 RepID=A0ABU5E6I9_9PROT|nr:heme exporter protein CcmB [Dongia soli]MDY0881881.1 heme exporter protein CcmB [Dongia soli]